VIASIVTAPSLAAVKLYLAKGTLVPFFGTDEDAGVVALKDTVKPEPVTTGPVDFV